MTKKPEPETTFRYRPEITEKAKQALDRIMLFNPDKTIEEVLSEIIIGHTVIYKGRCPPKGKK